MLFRVIGLVFLDLEGREFGFVLRVPVTGDGAG